MYAYKHILNSKNHIMWFLKGNPKSQCVRWVVDVAPLPSGRHPTDPNLMYVGIAVKFDGLTNGKSLEEEAKRYFDELWGNREKQQDKKMDKLRNKLTELNMEHQPRPQIKLQPLPQKKVEHKREESSRRQFVQCEKRGNHFHHTLQLKQPDKCH